MKRRKSLRLMGSLLVGSALAQALSSQASEPTVRLPQSRLDLVRLKQLLDRKDMAGAIQLVEQGWKQQYEEYYQGRLNTQLLTVDQIGGRLQDSFRLSGNRSALVYAIPTPDALELIVVVAGMPPAHRRVTAAKRETLMQVVKAFQLVVMDRLSSRSRYLRPAQQLYQLLIAPIERDLQKNQIDSLIFCLGGGLRSVPLAALHDGERFLIEKYRLTIIPAFNLLDRRPTSFEGAKVLAMGASEFQEQTPLPAVPLELTTIADTLWPGDVLLNQQFTLSNFQAYRSKQVYRIVHFATHADFSAGAILNSYIQFWDNRLSLDRVEDLKLRSPEVHLLVLSACQTAVGSPQAELGFAGLAVMSGSRSAIASLWHVSDVGTLVLMTEFYRLLKKLGKVEALRQTQIAMLNKQVSANQSVALGVRSDTLPAELRSYQNTDLSHPYYWAAFTVIGSPW